VSPKQKNRKTQQPSQRFNAAAITNYNKPASAVSAFRWRPAGWPANHESVRLVHPKHDPEECFGRRVEKDSRSKKRPCPIGMAKLAELAMIEPRTHSAN